MVFMYCKTDFLMCSSLKIVYGFCFGKPTFRKCTLCTDVMVQMLTLVVWSVHFVKKAQMPKKPIDNFINLIYDSSTKPDTVVSLIWKIGGISEDAICAFSKFHLEIFI